MIAQWKVLPALVILLALIPETGGQKAPEAQATNRWYPAGYYRGGGGYAAGYYPAGYYPVYEQPQAPIYAIIYSTYQPAVAAPPLVPNPVAPVAPAIPAIAGQPVGPAAVPAGQPLMPGQPPPQQPFLPQGMNPSTPYSCEAHTKAMEAKWEARFARMEALLLKTTPADKLPPGQSPAPKPEEEPQPEKAPMGDDAVSILKVRCASCHEEKASKVVLANGKTKGGKFVLFKGDLAKPETLELVPLTDKQRLAMSREIVKGGMPMVFKDGETVRGERLPQAEGAKLMKWIYEGE